MTWDPELLTGLGAALSIFLSASGSAYASAHSGIFALKHKSWKSFIPIVISGVLGIYGIIVSVLLVGKFSSSNISSNSNDGDTSGMPLESGYRNLSAGLAVGLACAASGFGIAIFMQHLNQHKKDQPTEANRNRARSDSDNDNITSPLLLHIRDQDQLEKDIFVRMVLCLCFMEAIGLYGLIVALFLMG